MNTSKKAEPPGTRVKTPNGGIYFVFYILMMPLMKVMFRLKIDRTGYVPPSGPFVVLCNHASFMDFVTVMLAVYPRRLNAVVAQKYFFYSPLNRFLPFVGCIPKSLFDPDPKSVISILSVMKRGGRLLLFPEGRCATGDAYMGMHKATGKLIKKLGVPVVCCHIEGAYTCMPFWRKGIRWGYQRATLTNLFSGEDTKTLTVDEINTGLDKRLGGAETACTPKPFSVLREKNLTAGLENILYYCPKCHKEFTLTTNGNSISCSNCGNTATMNREAKLTASAGNVSPVSIQKWYKMQCEYEKERLDGTSVFLDIEVSVKMPLSPGKGLEQCGIGKLTLDAKGWDFEGELKGGNIKLHFPIDTVPAIPFDPNDNFQIYAKGNFYAFTPVKDPRFCIKCATIGESAYWRFASQVQMTPGFDSGFV